MNFSVELTAWTYLLGGAVSWEAEYYDYSLDVIIPAGYHLMDERASFQNVSGGGYLAVRLYDGNTLTPWIYSTSFAPKDGEIWQFRLYYHGQQGDMVLLPVPVPGWVLVDKVTSTLAYQTGAVQVGWVLVGKVTSTLIKSAGIVVTGWVLVDKSALTLNRKASPIPPTPGEIPWGPIVGAVAVGVGAVVAGVAISKKKKTEANSHARR